jgi:5-methylcytosine-specific restriction endonuclease McrA
MRKTRAAKGKKKGGVGLKKRRYRKIKKPRFRLLWILWAFWTLFITRLKALQDELDLQIEAMYHAMRVRLLYPKSDRFFSSTKWQYLRIKTMKHYGAQCMRCFTRSGKMHVDHIKPRSLYPKLALSFRNLQVLCKNCNLEKGNKHETDYRPPAKRRSKRSHEETGVLPVRGVSASENHDVP